MSSGVARRLWMALEMYHATVYFEPRAKEIYEAAGLKGYWMGYFASRAAALGPVPPEVVVATFYNFEPSKIRRAIPDAWSFCPPERVLEARLEVADTALKRIEGDVVDAARLASAIAWGSDVSGRPLAAAHLSVPEPDDPKLQLWWATTVLREHRGDGHVAVLVSEGIHGCETHVLKHAAGEGPGPIPMTRSRGWAEDQWEDARAGLERRGLVRGNELTEEGARLRDHIETRTDELAMQPFEAAGSSSTDRLIEVLEPIAREVLVAETIPFPNPMGLPRPPDQG